MKNKLTLLLLLIGFISTAQLEWAGALTGTDRVMSGGIAVDDNDNIIVGGYFRQSADFDPGAGTHTLISNGGYDLFLSKYDPNGNLSWAISMGGANSDEISDIAVDNSGSIYITGRFQSDFIDMDPHSTTHYILKNSPGTRYDFFIAKYDANGNYLWAHAFGAPDAISNLVTSGRGIDVDKNGDIYVTGSFRGTIDFDPSVSTAYLTPHYSPQTTEGFVAKYTTNGDYLWAFNLGPSINYSSFSAQAIRVDNNGSVYVGGDFQGTVDFDPDGGAILYGNTANDGFIAKYTEDGDFTWVIGLLGEYQIRVYGLEVDETTGDVFVGGSFQMNVDFDPNGTGNTLSSSTTNGFLARYKSDGTLNWVNQFEGASNSTRSLALDRNGTIWSIGDFSNTVDFDPPSSNTATSSGSNDFFVGQHDANNGSFICVYGFGGTGYEESKGIATFTNGNMVVTANFQNTVDFDPNTGTYELTTTGSYGVPIVKLNSTCPSGTPLPVSFLKFNANCSEEIATLEWSTASEKNNDYFVIERSTDGNIFYSIATINGNGNSSTLNNYFYRDNSANSAIINYYRLKQVDYDGAFEYSTIISSNCVSDLLMVNQIKSNDNSITFNVSTPNNDHLTIALYDYSGKLIQNTTKFVNKGDNKVELNGLNLTSGIYLLNIVGQKTNYSSKLYQQ